MYVKYIQYITRSLYTPRTSRTEFRHVTFGYQSSLYSLIGSIVARATSTNSSSSALSSCDTWLIRSITILAPLRLFSGYLSFLFIKSSPL